MSSPWLIPFKPSPQATLRLFCFPYAGGSAAVYRRWSEKLPPSVELYAVELPGRGRRFGEPLFKRMNFMIPALSEALSSSLEIPFVFFGHSMGALIAFELTRYLRKEKSVLPELLFISGCGAPQNLIPPGKPLYQLRDDLFLKEVERLKGTPPEVLKHTELIQLFLPLIRADLEMMETYAYQEEDPLKIPICALGGKQDPEVSQKSLEDWALQTESGFASHFFSGDHFFIRSAEDEVLRVLGQVLGK